MFLIISFQSYVITAIFISGLIRFYSNGQIFFTSGIITTVILGLHIILLWHRKCAIKGSVHHRLSLKNVDVVGERFVFYRGRRFFYRGRRFQFFAYTIRLCKLDTWSYLCANFYSDTCGLKWRFNPIPVRNTVLRRICVWTNWRLCALMETFVIFSVDTRNDFSHLSPSTMMNLIFRIFITHLHLYILWFYRMLPQRISMSLLALNYYSQQYEQTFLITEIKMVWSTLGAVDLSVWGTKVRRPIVEKLREATTSMVCQVGQHLLRKRFYNSNREDAGRAEGLWSTENIR